MNARPLHQTRWSWLIGCLASGVIAACIAVSATQAGDAPAPADDHGDGLPAEYLLAAKLRSIVIPEVNFDDVTLEEAIEFLVTRAHELDQDPIPSTRGLNIVIEQDAFDSAGQINLDIRQVPAGHALRYITDLAGVTYRIDGFSVIVEVPRPGPTVVTRRYPATLEALQFVSSEMVFREGAISLHDAETSTLVVRNTLTELAKLEAVLARNDAQALHLRHYQVNLDVLEELRLGLRDQLAVDPFSAPVPAEELREPTIEDVLAAWGMIFGPGAGAFLDRETSTLYVRNTLAQHAALEVGCEGCPGCRDGNRGQDAQ